MDPAGHPFLRPTGELKVPLCALRRTTILGRSIAKDRYICATFGTTDHKATEKLIESVHGESEWSVHLPQVLLLSMDAAYKTFFVTPVAYGIPSEWIEKQATMILTENGKLLRDPGAHK